MPSCPRTNNSSRSPLLWVVAFTLLCGVCPVQAGIDEAGYIPIGGIDQWIEIHGQNASNPILLWLNGGPGGSMVPSAYAYEPWESKFTVVMWDQRGEGKTFEKYGTELADTMTIERMSQDGIEVAEYLHQRLPKAKLIVLGHSWGTVLGIRMIRSRPDLFAAYVGTGQVTQLLTQIEATYPQLLAYAKQVGNDQAVQELTEAGAPSASNPAAYDVANGWSSQFEPDELPAAESRRTPPEDRPDYLDQGEEFSWNLLNDALNREDVPALGTNFSVPMIFIQGDLDFVTDTSQVLEYYDRIKAPIKQLVLMKNHGHLAIMQDRDGFLEALLATVYPVIRPLSADSGMPVSSSN